MEHWKDAGVKAFAEEYGKLTMPGRMLLSIDFFRLEDRWQGNLLLSGPGGQLLMDTHGRELCRFEKITPLCRPVPNLKTATLVNDMLDQASVFRTRVPQERYRELLTAVEALAWSGSVLSDGYLVQKEGLSGLISPEGEWIVPMEYASIESFPFEEEDGRSTAGLYLCRRPGHSINPMDVYDLQGSCIFRGISNLYPREHTLLTPKDPELPPGKRLRSLWVSHQTIDHPFPENPEFLLTQDHTRRFSLKELASPLPPEETLRVGILEQSQNISHREPRQVPEDTLKELLTPMAQALSSLIHCPPEQILNRLKDYQAFQQERSGPRFHGVTPDTPLTQLNLPPSTLTCLLRSGLRTAGDLLTDRKLRNATPKIRQEVEMLQKQLIQML